MRTCTTERNTDRCNCTYSSCPRKGICCECVAYHRAKDQLPACYFPEDVEATFDRSIRRFVAVVEERGPRW